MTTASALHPFEKAGLGVGPFRCVGMEERRGPISLPDGGSVGAPGQPMGVCDYCGTGIAYCYAIRSADGKRFVVGSDCVSRTGADSAGDPLLIEVRRLERRHAADKREAKRQAAAQALQPRIEAARAMLEADPSLFADRPHPNAYFATQGKTLRDYYDYMLRFGGTDVRKQVCTAIEAAT